MKSLGLLLFVCVTYTSYSQNNSGISVDLRTGKLPLSKVIDFSEIEKQPDWAPVLMTHKQVPDGFSQGSVEKMILSKNKLQHMQSASALKKTPSNNKVMVKAAQPVLSTNFNGFGANNVPNDNHMAISNGGKIVSVFNNTLRVITTSGAVQLNKSLSSFASSLGTFTYNSDPRVVYDPKADRFVVMFFSGSTSTTSKVIVAFSQTNDPVGSWNFYQLSGNYLNDTTWTDYPIVTFSDDDLFITFNQLKDGAGDWRTAFRYSIIWQIDKNDGYNGNALNFNYWSNIKYNNKAIWNVCPVQGGSSPSGPETYFVSVRSYDFSNDTVFLHTVSNSKASGTAQFSTKVLKTNTAYGLPPNARQNNGQWLSTNDARILSAIIENNKIQYVQNTLDPVNFNSGVYLGSIDDPAGVNPVASGQVIASDTMDIAYPSIAYMGSGTNDNSVMITCSYLPVNGFAGTALYYKDKNGDLADVLRIKKGTNYMTYVKFYWGDTLERWGDYTGIQRLYNSPNHAWLSGSYVANQNAVYGSWIAKVTRTDTVLSTLSENAEQLTDVSVYPNPAVERVNVDFELKELTMLEFAVYDVQGRRVVLLLQDTVKPGKQKFSFNLNPLSKGVYFLKVSSDKVNLVNRKIVVQ